MQKNKSQNTQGPRSKFDDAMEESLQDKKGERAWTRENRGSTEYEKHR